MTLTALEHAHAWLIDPAQSALPSKPAFTVTALDQLSISVAPRTSTVGTARSIFVSGCTGPATIDESAIVAGRLILRVNPNIVYCGKPPTIISYTPRSLGTLRVQMAVADGSVVAEAPMDTVVTSHSIVNIDGMWFDPDTSGSGISFHHSAGSDAIFGTWFMYGPAPAGGTRWISLQSMQWISGGRTLVGNAYEATASALPSCALGDDCPRAATAISPVGSIGVLVIDQNNLRVEGYDRSGRTVFVSLMKRLTF